MQTERERRRELLLLFATLLWIIGAPTFLPPANQAMASIPVLKAERVAYFVVAGLLLAHLFNRPEALRRLGTLELAIAAYLAVALASWVRTVPAKDVVELKQDGDLLLTCFFMPFSAYLAARSIEWTQRRVTACLWVLVLGAGTCLVLIGLVQMFYDWDFLVADTIVDHRDRAKGTFRNAVPYGMTLAIVLMATLFLHLRSAGRRWRLVSIALALAIVQCIVGSKTRIVWVAVPVVLGFVAHRAPKLRVAAAGLAAVLAAQVLLGPLLGFDPWDLRSRLTQVLPAYDRVALAATALNMIVHRPVFGFGLGGNTFRHHKADYYASWAGIPVQRAEFPNSPHNEFLNVTVLMGVVGLVVYVALLGAIWRGLAMAYARQRATDPFAAELALVVQGAFLILLISGQLHEVMYISYPQILFFFLLGMAVREPSPTRSGGER